MSKHAIANIINFLEEIAARQKAVTQIKKDIAKLTHYHPNVIFNTIAPNNQIITITAFQQYLKDRTACNSRQLYEIFQRFDHSRRGSISRTDFYKQMTQGERLVKTNIKNSGITHQIQSKFLTLLNIIIKTCRVIDVWRKQLERTSPYDLFRLLNKSLTGAITPSQLFNFFYQNGKSFNQQQSKILHKSLLRAQYNQLTLEVFCENLKPLQFGQYPSYRDSLELINKKDIIQKETRFMQAKEAQNHYYKQLFSQKVKSQIHRQAALTREEQLEKRIQDEIRTYNELKFITRQKYHPDLLPQNHQLFDKQNRDQYNVHLREIENQARINQQTYRRKINRADAVMAVQSFKSQRNDNRISQSIASNKPQQIADQTELQKLIKKYTFSKINANLKPKRHIQRDALRQSYYL